MSVLFKEEIERRLFGASVSEEERLVVTPLLDRSAQIGDAAIDLRLSNELIVTHQTNIDHFDPLEKSLVGASSLFPDRYQTLVRVRFGESLVLHPNSLVLGSTLEYLALPKDVRADVLGRSSWGRLGLVIATATGVGPGFKGCITLEMVNFGPVPLVLYPGVRIAQLVMSTGGASAPYTGRYGFPTGPQFSRLSDDGDMDVIRRLKVRSRSWRTAG